MADAKQGAKDKAQAYKDAGIVGDVDFLEMIAEWHDRHPLITAPHTKDPGMKMCVCVRKRPLNSKELARQVRCRCSARGMQRSKCTMQRVVLLASPVLLPTKPTAGSRSPPSHLHLARSRVHPSFPKYASGARLLDGGEPVRGAA